MAGTAQQRGPIGAVDVMGMQAGPQGGKLVGGFVIGMAITGQPGRIDGPDRDAGDHRKRVASRGDQFSDATQYASLISPAGPAPR